MAHAVPELLNTKRSSKGLFFFYFTKTITNISSLALETLLQNLKRQSGCQKETKKKSDVDRTDYDTRQLEAQPLPILLTQYDRLTTVDVSMY